MPALLLDTTACVLAKRLPTDSHQPLVVFSPEYGVLNVYQRVNKAPANAAADLFDEAELVLSSANQGKTWFARESKVTKRRIQIGRSYEALKRASDFGTLIVRNEVPPESRVKVFRLLNQALEALADPSKSPDLIYLKALYSFARDEGYPVRQQWLESLQPELKASAEELIHTPPTSDDRTRAIQSSVSKLILRLEDYLRTHTEILVDS